MIRLRPLISLVVTLVVSCPAWLHAVECRILGWDADVPDVIIRTSEGERVLTVSSHFISAPWSAPADRPVVLQTATPATATAPAGRATLASVTLPPDVPRVLLILATERGAGDETRHRLVAVPDLGPPGERHVVRLQNFTRQPALWSLAGRAPERVAPMGAAQASFEPAARRARLRVAVPEAGGGWRVVASRNVPTPEGHRVLLFLREAVFDPEHPSRPAVEVREIFEPVEPSA